MVKIFIEQEEALQRYGQLINTRFLSINAFLFTALILRVFLNVSFPNSLFFLISVMLISTIIYDFFLSRIKTPTASQIINGYFIYLLFDLITITIIIYIIGGVTWIGFIFYGLYFYIALLLFPRNYYLFIIFYCSFLYTLLVTIQYLGILPYQELFVLEERVPQNIYYVFSTWIAAVIFLWILGYYGYIFHKILQGKIGDLQKTRKTLEEERGSLEIRVHARTDELWEARKGLEKEVRERTKELEKQRRELTKKVTELERFHKVAVDRELKMRELKKEIERLEKENKTKK